MRRSSLLKVLIGVLLIGLALAPVQSTQAASVSWSYANGTDLDVNSNWTYYSRQHNLGKTPYGIYLYKEDGPSLQAQWWNCGLGGSNGPVVGVSNADPSSVYLKENGTAPLNLTWCFAVRNTSGGADTITGFLDWDGTY